MTFRKAAAELPGIRRSAGIASGRTLKRAIAYSESHQTRRLINQAIGVSIIIKLSEARMREKILSIAC